MATKRVTQAIVKAEPELQSALAPVFAFSPKELEKKKAELAEAEAFAHGLKVTDAVTLEEANEWAKAIKAEKDAIEEMRTSVTKPLNAVLKQVNGWFKPLTAACETVERSLKAKIGEHVAAQRRLQESAYKAAAAAHAQGAHDAARSALTLAGSADTATPQGTSVREVWRAEIINPKLVPYEFVIPNEPLIQAHARATPADQEPTPIAGVRFVKDSIVTVRK